MSDDGDFRMFFDLKKILLSFILRLLYKHNIKINQYFYNIIVENYTKILMKKIFMIVISKMFKFKLK